MSITFSCAGHLCWKVSDYASVCRSHESEGDIWLLRQTRLAVASCRVCGEEWSTHLCLLFRMPFSFLKLPVCFSRQIFCLLSHAVSVPGPWRVAVSAALSRKEYHHSVLIWKHTVGTKVCVDVCVAQLGGYSRCWRCSVEIEAWEWSSSLNV